MGTHDLLGKLFMEAAPAPPKRRTLEMYRRSWMSRVAIRKVAGFLGEGNLPSDDPDPEHDVAFGITKKKHLFLSADQAKDEHGQPHKRKGMISHVAMLYAAGLAKTPDDPKPSDDYACRGIVKHRMDGKIIFWETTDQLTTARLAPYVRECIDGLLQRKLITPETEVFGANEDVAVATAGDISRDW